MVEKGEKVIGSRNGFLLAAAILLVTHGFAWAAQIDPDLPKTDPEGYWRVVTQDSATTTSHCIGRTTTPECAFETEIAAYFRGDNALLSKSTGLVRPLGDGKLQKESSTKIKYRIVSCGRVDKNASKFDDMHNNIPWVKGDIWIVTDERECWGEKCANPAPEMQKFQLQRYALHKHGKYWNVIYHGDLHWEQ